MLEEFDPNTIEDEGLRQVFQYLMNLVESLSAKVAEQAEEIQRLRDENNRLKGEQGKPKILPNTKAKASLSSEKERRESKPHHKATKHAEIRIDRAEAVKVDEEHVPADAQFKGYEDVIVQDIAFRTENIRFRKEKYYSPSQKRTYLAALPTGYTGQFGPGVRAWVLTLYYADGMSEPKILDLLQTVGMSISAGQLSDMLIKDQEQFHAEQAHVLQAGLSSSRLLASRQYGHPSQWQKRTVSYPLQPVVYRLLYLTRQRSPESASRSSRRSRSRLSAECARLGAAASVGRLGEVVSHASHAIVARPDLHGEAA